MNKLCYRLSLDKSGNWRLFHGDNTLASGTIPGLQGDVWHRMRLSFSGDRISASIDSEPLAQVTDSSVKSGMAYIASTFHPNHFDNMSFDKP